MGIIIIIQAILMVAIAGLLALAGKIRTEREDYKTAVWAAVGKAEQGKSVEEIKKTVECYMPECDKAHFRRDFYGDKND